MNNLSIVLIAIIALFSLSSAIKTRQQGGLPNGFYEVEHYGDAFCQSKPSRFTYKQLDVCAVDVLDPQMRTLTTCSLKSYETRTKCVKSCRSEYCATVTEGEIGCIQINEGYSIERTCGPPPASLTGYKWLLNYKSDISNCTGSILREGRIADGSCVIRGLDYGQTVDCTDTMSTVISWGGCDKPDCGKSFCHFSVEEGPSKNIGICKDSKTLQCLQL